jgi:hypothetical protein
MRYRRNRPRRSRGRMEFDEVHALYWFLTLLQVEGGYLHGLARKRSELLHRLTTIAATMSLALALLPSMASAHDSWISRGGLRNGAGEWCCGEGDCAVMDIGAVQAKPYGYVIYGRGTIGDGPGAIRTQIIDEIIPTPEAQPSPDGQYWRCQRPDKSRRCFFFPPPGS